MIEPPLGIRYFFASSRGKGDFRMRSTGIQVTDDAIGDLCVSQELAAIQGEIEGNAQQANTDQGEKQAQQYLPDG
ncbi:hypothetical protein [Pseudomonas sp. Pf153]|uniref:hypothetical protein n=1 Tax=Pseudomonas sp. Pf153 TaxID=1699309 RepID=UPI00155DA48E|nr:hypothetical protein [Pseudomonas sp. Pf153]